MTPKSPVIAGLERYEHVYGIGQLQYVPLPALRSPDGRVMSRWELTAKERQQIADGADVLVTLHTFNEPYQPTRLEVARVDSDPSVIACRLCLSEYFDKSDPKAT
jgi:hypothetical protein